MRNFGPYTVDSDRYRITRQGPGSGPLPGTTRWELWDITHSQPVLECHTATKDGAPDSEGISRLLPGESVVDFPGWEKLNARDREV